jgi:predicted TIM-barrel fold metal-dependent hydrolase
MPIDSVTRSLARGALALLVVASSRAAAQMPADSALVAYIASIRAIDSHAHPMRPVPPGAPADTEFDALPLDGIPPFPMPWRLTLDNPAWREAQRAIYGLSSADSGAAFRTELEAAATRVRAEQGERFPAWALDRAGIDVMLSNRIAMGPGLAPPRFRWVSFVDALMLPLDTRGEATRSPDTRSLYPKEAALLRRYLGDLGLRAIPATLDGYVRTVLTPTLERQRRGGAVAVKFEAAYLRPLDFDTPDPATARRVYARYAAGGAPTRAEYKALEDYLFREIAREAGRLGMAVQIHTLEGFGGFYSSKGSAPHLMESAFSDSTLRGTHFVIVHGGWPRVDETLALLAKPNVYADLSAMALYVPPSELARVLRLWLGEWPDKVMFGTDAFDGGPEQGWADVAYVGTSTVRRALATALTGMMRDGEIGRARAEEVARMVMRENAVRAYALGAR